MKNTMARRRGGTQLFQLIAIFAIVKQKSLAPTFCVETPGWGEAEGTVVGEKSTGIRQVYSKGSLQE